MYPAIVIPTFNERENIERLVSDIFEQSGTECMIVIVDDQSQDGTQEAIKNLEKKYPRLFGIVRTKQRSFAQSYCEGFHFAFLKGATHCIEMDADGSHRVPDLMRMIDALRSSPVVVGSRYCKGGKMLNWPLFRKFLSRGGNWFARCTTGIPLTDITSGFVGYERSVLERIPYQSIQCEGYSFQIEMKWLVCKAGIPLQEIPITFIEREQGVSKMSSRIVREAMLFCLKKFFKKKI